jgi:RHS repeat-associated protein
VVNQKFTGKERDAETGLDFFEARYFSAAQGRFTSPDEFKGGFLDAFTGQAAFQSGPLPYADISDPQTLNKYAYVRNNPLRYTDPDGHCLWDLCAVEGYVAITAAAAATGAAIVYVQTHKQELQTLVNTIVDKLSSSPPATPAQPQQAQGTPGTSAETPAGVQGPIQASEPLVGNNPREAKGRTNTDLPGGQDAAKDTFGQLTQGQKVVTDPTTGHQVAADGTRLRLNPDGTARVDVPKSATRPKNETIHFNKPDKPQGQQP